MKYNNKNILPQTKEYLEILGYQIKLARKRRKINLQLVADRAGISRRTATKIEQGDPTVSIGSYAAVLHALDGLDEDITLIAKNDITGRRIQDFNL